MRWDWARVRDQEDESQGQAASQSPCSQSPGPSLGTGRSKVPGCPAPGVPKPRQGHRMLSERQAWAEASSGRARGMVSTVCRATARDTRLPGCPGRPWGSSLNYPQEELAGQERPECFLSLGGASLCPTPSPGTGEGDGNAPPAVPSGLHGVGRRNPKREKKAQLPPARGLVWAVEDLQACRPGPQTLSLLAPAPG